LKSLFNNNKNQTLLTEQNPNKKFDELLKLTQKNTYLIHVSEKDIVLGREVKYKRIVREYKILDVDGLREITMKNKVQYRKDKKKWERNEKEGNGYG